MNTKNSLFKCLAFGSVILSLTMELVGADYTAHEWGTFTSVQGGDGELLSWQPLKTSELPSFVHDWTKPGLNRASGKTIDSNALLSKTVMVTLQRMETPVIYFYSDKSISVDVSVAFPKGSITEWYPQATQIGPSHPADTNAPSGALSESRATWSNLKLVPLGEQYGGNYRLPEDKSGSHYFAARTPASDIVQTSFTDNGKTVAETDKFIFYRGVGSFKTPLRVSVDTNDTVTVENTGPENLSHLFLISIDDRGFALAGSLATKESLPAHSAVRWQRLSSLPTSDWEIFGPEELKKNLAIKMEAALANEGLFADEAKAMVNTWKDSWFTEVGVRVLYILPRTWTDETLPLTLNPQPDKLERVMVGRAEIITPNDEMTLFQSLSKAQNGDANARVQAMAELKRFGRFAEPAIQLANRHANQTNVVALGYELLNGSGSSNLNQTLNTPLNLEIQTLPAPRLSPAFGAIDSFNWSSGLGSQN